MLENFRAFNKKTTIEFNEELNVIIGHNNAGKTTVISALELLFNNQKSKRLSIDDFNKSIKIEKMMDTPPKITLSAVLRESEREEEYSDELATVATWLTKLESPYEARLTYEFYLPEKELDEYKAAMDLLNKEDVNNFWKMLEHDFIRKYKGRLYVGNPDHKNLLETEHINKFSFQFLSAIRNVDRDLYSGRNSLLREVIDFFIDYEIKSDDTIKSIEKNKKISDRKKKFSLDAQNLIG